MSKQLMILLIGVFGSIGASALELSGSPDELRNALEPTYPTVSIRGTAKETTYSNLALITILVTTKEDSLSQSLEKNTRERQTLVAGLQKLGISPKDIKNAEFSSSPHFGLFRGKKPSKYTVENKLQVTARTEGQLLSVNRVIDQSSLAELGEIEFELEKEDELKQALKMKAIEDAVSQGKAYGSALGLKLVAKEFSFSARRNNNANRMEEVVVTARRSSRSYSEAPSPEPVTFEKLEYQASIDVIFEARPIPD